MQFKDLMTESVQSIKNNPSRATLLLLGLVIGITSVITVVSMGRGASEVIADLLGGMGSKSVLIYPNWKVIDESRGKYRYEELTQKDIDDLNSKIPGLKGVSPSINMNFTFTRKGRSSDATLLGTLPMYFELTDLQIQRGRLLAVEDNTQKRKAAVLGAWIAKELFPGEDPIGQTLTVKNVGQLSIVGVLKEEEQGMASSISGDEDGHNRTVFVPASTIERVGGQSNIYFLQGEALSEDGLEDLVKRIQSLLNYNHGLYDGKHNKYVVMEMKAILDTIDQATGTLTLFISIIAGISLVVAGVSVINIMLISVKERTREIGTRKAIGAPPYMILNQFMIETLILCGSGGILGTLFSLLAVFIISKVTGWPALFDRGTVLLSISLALITGLIAGMIPASRAADMDPVEALRYE